MGPHDLLEYLPTKAEITDYTIQTYTLINPDPFPAQTLIQSFPYFHLPVHEA